MFTITFLKSEQCSFYVGNIFKPVYLLGFRYDIIFPLDRMWGSLVNGVWNGFPRQLQTKVFLQIILQFIAKETEPV